MLKIAVNIWPFFYNEWEKGRSARNGEVVIPLKKPLDAQGSGERCLNLVICGVLQNIWQDSNVQTGYLHIGESDGEPVWQIDGIGEAGETNAQAPWAIEVFSFVDVIEGLDLSLPPSIIILGIIAGDGSDDGDIERAIILIPQNMAEKFWREPKNEALLLE